MPTKISVPMFALLATGLVACGGGGGGGDAPPASGSTVFPALALTAGNAEQTTREVSTTGSETIGVGDVGSLVITGAVVDAEGGPALAQVARWSMETLHARRDQLTTSLSGVVINETVNCTSGSISLSWNDADNDDEFSSGDSFTINFNNCVEMGATLNGSLGMSGFTINGDPDVDIAWNMGATFTFTALTINDGGDSIRVDGEMNFNIATMNGDDVEVDISGSSLAYYDGLHTTTLRSYVFAYTEQLSSGLYSLEYSGVLDMGSLSGRVTFDTTTPFTGSDILDNWPTAGTLRITGANDSAVTLEALGADTIQISIDSNGDGNVDQTIMTTWTALTLA